MDQIIRQIFSGQKIWIDGIRRCRGRLDHRNIGDRPWNRSRDRSGTAYSRAQFLLSLRCVLHQRFGHRLWRAASPDRDDRAQPKAGGDYRLLRGPGDGLRRGLRPQPRIHFAAVQARGIVAQDTPRSQIRRDVRKRSIQTSPPNGSRRVVLADDDATTIVMLSTILKHFNFECDIAHDGEQALEIARRKRTGPGAAGRVDAAYGWIRSLDCASRRYGDQEYAGDPDQRAS